MVRNGGPTLVRALLLLGLGAIALFLAAREWLPGFVFSRGRAALQGADWPRVDKCAARLEQVGCRAEALRLRGEAALQRGRKLAEAAGGHFPPTAARTAFRSALADLSRVRDDSTNDSTILAAECLVRLGELRLAANALETLLRQQPDQAEAHRWLAAVYIDLNVPAEAVRHLTRWGELDLGTGLPFRWAGFFHKFADRPSKAIEAYRTALQRHLEPSLRADTIRELVEVLLESERAYEAALRSLDELPKPDRAKPGVLALRAECLRGLGRADEAAKAAEQAIAASPSLPAALQVRAHLHAAAGQPQAARPLLEKAVEAAPHDPGVRQQLMEVCHRLGDEAAAARHKEALAATTALRERLTSLQRDAERRPWDPAVRRQIAELCLELHRPAEARMWAWAALACAPNDSAAEQLLARADADVPPPTFQIPEGRP
jgi:tetratricopeptide (TPR) repeat protein